MHDWEGSVDVEIIEPLKGKPRCSVLPRQKCFWCWKPQCLETEDISRKSGLLSEVFNLSDRTKCLSSHQGQWRETDTWHLNLGAAFQKWIFFPWATEGIQVWVRCNTHAVNNYTWWWMLRLLSFFALQDWNQPSGPQLGGSHPIYPFCIAWFISSSISPFFLALEMISLLEGNLSAPGLMVAGSLEIPTKEQIKHFC